MNSEWIFDLQIISIIFIYVSASIFIPKHLEEIGKISKHTARKLIHSFAGLTVFSAPYLNHSWIAFIIAFLLTIVTRFSSTNSKKNLLKGLFDAIGEDEEMDAGYLQGPFAYCLSISILTFIFLFFPTRFYYPISSILIMMYADTAASIIGRKYGKHHIKIPKIGDKRTIEGTISFIIVAWIVSIFTFFFLGMIIPGNSIVLDTEDIFSLSLIISFVSAFLELISPSKYDDLIIPLGTTFFISISAFLLHIW